MPDATPERASANLFAGRISADQHPTTFRRIFLTEENAAKISRRLIFLTGHALILKWAVFDMPVVAITLKCRLMPNPAQKIRRCALTTLRQLAASPTTPVGNPPTMAPDTSVPSRWIWNDEMAKFLAPST